MSIGYIFYLILNAITSHLISKKREVLLTFKQKISILIFYDV